MSRTLAGLIPLLLLVSTGCSLDEPVENSGAGCPGDFLNGANSGTAIRSGSNGKSLAQAFTLTQSATITSADVMLSKSGSPASSIIATIQTSASGLPNGTPIATSNSVTAANVSSTGPTKFTFTSPVSLGAGTYHLVLTVGYTASPTNNVTWKGSTTDSFGAGYAVTTDTGDTFKFDTAIADYTISLGCL